MYSPVKKARLEESSSEEDRASSQQEFSSTATSISVTGSENVVAGGNIQTHNQFHNKISAINIESVSRCSVFVTAPLEAIPKKLTRFCLTDAPTPNFVGRKELVAKIHSLLKACSTMSSWLDRTVIIHGLGGMGKSELARKYVQLHINEPIIQNVAWIDSETKKSLENSFQKIARKFKLQTEKLDAKEIVEIVYEHFSENFDAGLFIYDNVEQLQDQEPYFGILEYLPTQLQGRLPLILITSRINDWEAPDGRDNTVGISELGEDQAVQLLIAKLKLNESQKKDTDIQASIRNLAQVIQGYPLGLTLAASNILSSTFVNVAEEIQKYIERLNKPKSGWIDDKLSGGSVNKYNLIMNNVWKATFDRIGSMGVAGECALTLLNIIAYLPTDDIKKSLVDEILGFGYSSLKDHVAEGYSYLVKFSLVSLLKKYDEDEVEDFFVRVHRHVQRCTRERLDSVQEHCYLLSIGRYLCHIEVYKYGVKEMMQNIHRELKQRKWPEDSFRLSIIFLSRYWDFEFAVELAMDLSEAAEDGVQDYINLLESGYQMLLELSLYLVSEYWRDDFEKYDEATAALKRQWNKKHKKAFAESIEIFTSALTLRDFLLTSDVFLDVQQRILDVTRVVLSYRRTLKKCRIEIRDALLKALNESKYMTEHFRTISAIYDALSIYDADESNQNSALGLKAALQLHFKCYSNDSLLQNDKLLKNAPMHYSRLIDALKESKRKRTNPEECNDWEKSIIKTFLASGGIKVVQQNLCCSHDEKQLSDVIRFISLLVINYDCSEVFKETPNFLHTINIVSRTTDSNYMGHRMLLWLALFPSDSAFEDAEGRTWSLDSVIDEMKSFLESYWDKKEKKLWFRLDETDLMKALFPHLILSESNGERNMPFETAVALMNGDICWRQLRKSLDPQGWETVFKTRFSTERDTPKEILDVGKKFGLI